MKTQNEHWLKKSYQKATLETKLLIVDQILNGQISNNQSSKKYDIPRTTISYWLRKYRTLVQQNNGMSKTMRLKS
jgi:transposase-like protein